MLMWHLVNLIPVNIKNFYASAVYNTYAINLFWDMSLEQIAYSSYLLRFASSETNHFDLKSLDFHSRCL